MAQSHDKWICVVTCLCADGRTLRAKVTTTFNRACPMEEAELRARAIASEVERELARSRTPESAMGRETDLANRLLLRANPAHDIATVELALGAADRRTNSAAFRVGPTTGDSGLMRAVAPVSVRGHSIPPEAAPPRPEASSKFPGPDSLSERRGRVLLVHGNVQLLTRLIAAFTGEFEVLTATAASQAETILASGGFDLVIASHELRDGGGLAFVRETAARTTETTCIVLTSRAGYPEVMQAMREAAISPRVVIEPFEPAELLSKARSVVTLARMREAADQLHKRRAEESDG